MLRMILAQLLLLDTKTQQQANKGRARKQNIHLLQRIPISALDNISLMARQVANNVHASSGLCTTKQTGHLGAKFSPQSPLLCLHLVVENDATDRDGDGRAQLAEEAETGGCGTDIARLNVGLQRNEGGLEVGTDTNASNDLEDDNFGPVSVVAEVDEETEPESHDGEAEHDGDFIVARALDDDADAGRGDGEREHKGEQVDTGEEGGCAHDGLEVQREPVTATHEGECVHEGEGEGGDARSVGEQRGGHDGILGDLGFVHDEQTDGDEAKDNQTNNHGRVPGMLNAAKLQTKEKHERAANDQ